MDDRTTVWISPTYVAPTTDDTPSRNEGYYGGSPWDLELRDFMNNPSRKSVVSVFGPGFSKELPGFRVRNGGAVCDNLPDPPLICGDTI